MALSTPVSGLSLPCLVLLLLLEIPGAGAQEFQLLQPQGAVSVLAGETLTLICSQTANAPVGPVKWFKGSGSGRQLVYDQVGSLPRVTRAVNGSNTDFTIHISDTRPEDAGIYRCVKFVKVSVVDEEIRSGAGTVVSVSVPPRLRVGTAPTAPVALNESVTFTCRAEGFYPKDASLTWLENGNETNLGKPSPLTENPDGTYTLQSSMEVKATEQRNQSMFTCRAIPVRPGHAPGRALGGGFPPRLRVGTAPAVPVALNESVTFTCYAEGFYPKDASLTWLENGHETNLGKPSPMAENPDGTYTLQSSLEVKATEQRNQSVFTCRVVHDSQLPVNANATLRLSQVPADLFSSPALWIGLVLEKVLTAAFLFFLFLRSKA
uniref:Ig-like domain-containing protein n=1 Tax=Chrysemys picta bellii TaxID=8478 RepID=A0A8C3FCZ6_CHRPI